MNGYVDKAGKWHPGSDSWEALRAELTTLRGIVGDLADYGVGEDDTGGLFSVVDGALVLRAKEWKESHA